MLKALLLLLVTPARISYDSLLLITNLRKYCPNLLAGISVQQNGFEKSRKAIFGTFDRHFLKIVKQKLFHTLLSNQIFCTVKLTYEKVWSLLQNYKENTGA